MLFLERLKRGGWFNGLLWELLQTFKRKEKTTDRERERRMRKFSCSCFKNVLIWVVKGGR